MVIYVMLKAYSTPKGLYHHIRYYVEDQLTNDFFRSFEYSQKREPFSIADVSNPGLALAGFVYREILKRHIREKINASTSPR